MINSKSVLAVIPARGGSKGLLGKNILPLAGKPLIAWTIESAIESKYIDKCIILTDDQEIADISLKSARGTRKSHFETILRKVWEQNQFYRNPILSGKYCRLV